MIDEAGGNEHGYPAEGVGGFKRQATVVVLNAPDYAAHWLPFPEQQNQCDAAEKDIRAALDYDRDDSRPGGLKPLPGHHAVLNGKQAQQGRIDRERVQKRRLAAGINGFWNAEIPYKSDRVKKSREKYQIANDAIKERRDSIQHLDSLSLGPPSELCRRSELERPPTAPINPY